MQVRLHAICFPSVSGRSAACERLRYRASPHICNPVSPLCPGNKNWSGLKPGKRSVGTFTPQLIWVYHLYEDDSLPSFIIFLTQRLTSNPLAQPKQKWPNKERCISPDNTLNPVSGARGRPVNTEWRTQHCSSVTKWSSCARPSEVRSMTCSPETRESSYKYHTFLEPKAADGSTLSKSSPMIQSKSMTINSVFYFWIGIFFIHYCKHFKRYPHSPGLETQAAYSHNIVQRKTSYIFTCLANVKYHKKKPS